MQILFEVIEIKLRWWFSLGLVYSWHLPLVAAEDGEFASAVMADIESRVREEATVSIESQAQMRFSVWVSFVEVYNEQIFDLLEPLPKKKGAKRSVLQLREDKNGVPYVKGELLVTPADSRHSGLVTPYGNIDLGQYCFR